MSIFECFGNFSFNLTIFSETSIMFCVESPIIDKTQSLSSLSLTLVEETSGYWKFQVHNPMGKHGVDQLQGP